MVAAELQQRGFAVAVPSLHGTENTTVPYWQQHADAAARQLRDIDPSTPIVLVANTAAGVLLPAIRQALQRPVAAYVFVDAGIPQDGKSRTDLARIVAPDAPRVGDADIRLPNWRDEDLRAEVPDTDLRAAVLAELHPQPLAFRQEPIPVFAGWPDAPCGYIKFTRGFQTPAVQAQQNGWAYREFAGGHFHPLVAPAAVTEALIEVAAAMGVDA